MNIGLFSKRCKLIFSTNSFKSSLLKLKSERFTDKLHLTINFLISLTILFSSFEKRILIFFHFILIII